MHILEIHDGGQASTQLNRLFLVRRLLRAQRQVHERAVRQQRDEANGDAGREEARIPVAKPHPLQACPDPFHPLILLSVNPSQTRCRR